MFGAVGAAEMAVSWGMAKDDKGTSDRFGGDPEGAEHQWQTKRLCTTSQGRPISREALDVPA